MATNVTIDVTALDLIRKPKKVRQQIAPPFNAEEKHVRKESGASQ